MPLSDGSQVRDLREAGGQEVYPCGDRVSPFGYRVRRVAVSRGGRGRAAARHSPAELESGPRRSKARLWGLLRAPWHGRGEGYAKGDHSV